MFDMRITDKMAELLGSKRRARFLSLLGLALSTVARDSYPGELGNETSSLQSINEMLIVIFKQLAALTAGSEAAYPDDAFLVTLVHHAREARPAAALQWAVDRVLEKREPIAAE